jgi:hypothetical protein
MVDIDKIIAFESGELDTDEVLDLFSELVSDGTVWSLQGSYGRTASALIDAGYLTPEGERV